MVNEKCILDPERDCLGLIEVRSLKEEFNDFRSHNERNHKEFFDRLASVESYNKMQDIHYDHIIKDLGNISVQLEELQKRITDIEFKPAKRWDGMVEKIIGLLVAASVGYLLSRIGLQ